MNGLWFLIGVAAAIVLMAVIQALIDHRWPDLDLRGEPWHPDLDHALRPRPAEPVRDERGVVWPRVVAEPTESELRLLDGNR